MTGSCPVGAEVCREAHAERDRLRGWKADALPVFDGLQELGKALGLPLGSQITGQQALAAVERLTRERDEARDALDILVKRQTDDQLKIERLQDALIEERQTCWLAHPEGMTDE